MWFLSKPSTDHVEFRNSCEKCEIWRELYERERAERLALNETILVRFGVKWQERLTNPENFQPITHHSAAKVLSELELKSRREAERIAREKIDAAINDGALDAAESTN
jgi:hypothetical protein